MVAIWILDTFIVPSRKSGIDSANVIEEKERMEIGRKSVGKLFLPADITIYLYLFLAVVMATEYLNNKTFEGIISKFQITKNQKARYELIIEDLLDTTMRKKARKVNYSADRVRLEKDRNAYRHISDEHFDSKQDLALAFYTLSENIVNYARFNLIDPDDAVQEGVMICFEKIDRFDDRKGKAFNYMTTCILNHFRQLYRTARNYNELKKKYLRYLQAVESQILIRNGKEIAYWKQSSA